MRDSLPAKCFVSTFFIGFSYFIIFWYKCLECNLKSMLNGKYSTGLIMLHDNIYRQSPVKSPEIKTLK